MNNFSINISDGESSLQNNNAGMPEPKDNHHDFEQQYLALRNKENRIYTNEELAKLPEITVTHPHYKEWLVRKASSTKLIHHLQRKKKSLGILEIGCGNGWLSNQLSLHVSCQVTGININRSELEQAQRVFKYNTECHFMYVDIQSEVFNRKKFDTIIFAASIQYFPSLKSILGVALKLLKPGGEIHILDTHFYKPAEVAEAIKRSKLHFTSLGFPGMSDRYFHHSLDELTNFNPAVLYDPFSFINRFFKSKAPFYWFCIRKDFQK